MSIDRLTSRGRERQPSLRAVIEEHYMTGCNCREPTLLSGCYRAVSFIAFFAECGCC